MPGAPTTSGKSDPQGSAAPKLNGFTAEEPRQLILKVLESDENIRNRVSLALRWYLKPQRHTIPVGELRIDFFIYYWIAFEALAMPDGDYRSALRILDEIPARFSFSLSCSWRGVYLLGFQEVQRF